MAEARRSNTVYPIRHMVVVGEITTGFEFYGPFETVALAGRWANDNLKEGMSRRVHDMFDVGERNV